MTVHFWNEEEIKFLRKYYPSLSQKDLLVKFNEHFNLDIRKSQLVGCLKNYNIKSGRTGYFEKGSTPANKGQKGLIGANRTSFQKGHKPANYKPVGYERIDRDGYILMKVSDKGEWHERWRHKHKVVWEQHNGSIPKGHVIIFLDGDKTNVSIENLYAIPNKVHIRLNNYHLRTNNPETNAVAINIARIMTSVGERQKQQ